MSLRSALCLLVSVSFVLLAAPVSAAPSIQVLLPKDRTKCGTLVLRNGAGKVVVGPFKACGVADAKTAKKRKNEKRSTLAPYGDTPVGGYDVVSIFRVGDGTKYKQKSYGDFAAVRLLPKTGEAKLAADIGRAGLLIHGGDLGLRGRLRPTNGCIRLSNADMKELVAAMVLLKATEGQAQACGVELSTSVQVSEPDESTGYDEGDPPPTGEELLLPVLP